MPMPTLPRLAPWRLFLVFGIVFGALFLLLTPPMQAPDEVSHYYRAYQVSEGQWMALRYDRRVGGWMPQGVVDVAEAFLPIRWKFSYTTSFVAIRSAAQLPLRPDERVFVDFPNTALFPWVAYAPAATAIALSRGLGAGPLLQFYAARLSSWLLWLGLGVLMLRVLPHSRWLFLVVGLLPMAVFVQVSISADVATNSLCWLFIALCLRYRGSSHRLRPRQLGVLAGLLLLLASCKLVYAAVGLLLMLLPAGAYSRPWQRWGFPALVALLMGGLIAYWSAQIDRIYLPYPDYHPDFAPALHPVSLSNEANLPLQRDYVLAHPGALPGIFWRTLQATFSMYSRGLIGTFGWLEVVLPPGLILTAYGGLLAVALTDGRAGWRLSAGHRVWLALAFVAGLGLLLLSQYLTWAPVAAPLMWALQGRYLLPLLPLLLLLFYLPTARFRNLAAGIAIALSLVLLGFSTDRLYRRYFQTLGRENLQVYTSVEEVYHGGLVYTNQPNIFIDCGLNRSTTHVRTGAWSIQLGPAEFGCLLRFFAAEAGDHVGLSFWRYGSTGGEVVVVAPGTDLYAAGGTVTAREGEWEKIEFALQLPTDLKGRELAVYLHHTGAQPTWYDDVTIWVEKAGSD